jgi:hypothetical protein
MVCRVYRAIPRVAVNKAGELAACSESRAQPGAFPGFYFWEKIACKDSDRAVPNERTIMNKIIEYRLFNEPISRRTFYWLVFLCPVAALWIYFASRRVVVSSPRTVPGVSAA